MQGTTDSQHIQQTEHGRGRASFLLRVRLLSLGIAAIVTLPFAFGLWSTLRFGSPLTGISYLRGEILVVDPSNVLLEPGKPGELREATVTVRNTASYPVRLVGANTDCSCIVANDLPLTIAAQSFAKLKLIAKYKPKKDLRQTMIYYTDCPTQPQFLISVEGKLAHFTQSNTSTAN